MRAEAVGAGLGDDPLRPHRDRGLGVRRKRHVAPVATLEVDAPESPRSAVLATELRHLGAGRQQRRRAGVAKLVEIDLVAAGLAQQPAELFALCVLIDAAGVDHKPIRLPLSVVSWPPAAARPLWAPLVIALLALGWWFVLPPVVHVPSAPVWCPVSLDGSPVTRYDAREV